MLAVEMETDIDKANMTSSSKTRTFGRGLLKRLKFANEDEVTGLN